MPESASSGNNSRPSVKALERRAKVILKARPAYQEMVDFYLPVFRRQIEWRDRLVVHPEEVTAEQARECLRKGMSLVEGHDPGLEADSLGSLWAEMKAVFRQGNDVLREAVGQIDHAEQEDGFTPSTWLSEQRPDRSELLTDASRQIGIDESILTTLARAVTFPHWEAVARSWLPAGRLDEWKRFRCPTCGGMPGLVENRKERSSQEGISAASRRVMHCLFCGSCWDVPALTCPACGSTKDGDAKYLFTAEEPELRIEFCKSCHHYIKVVDGDRISGPIHVGLELLAAAHLDMLARDKSLSPLEVCV